MLEFHGWAKIREAYREINEDDTKLDVAISKLRKFIADQYSFYAVVEETNGSFHLCTTGESNHWRDPVLELFEFIAQVAPGSYGLLYIHDGENVDAHNEFQVWVLKKGKLQKRSDPFLSPYFPEVEEVE